MARACVNRECSRQNKRTVTADHFSLALYSVEGEDDGNRKVCIECKEMARSHKKDLIREDG